MKKCKMLAMSLLILLISLSIVLPRVWADEAEWPKEIKPYPVPISEFYKYKAKMDDPRPFLKDTGWYKEFIPPEIWPLVTWDEEKMKETWAEAIGFKSPEVVGKIAPELKPGKYTCKDKEKFPFKELMWEDMYNRFNPAGVGTPNHMGNFTEIEVVPTRQYYWSLPIAEATIENVGKTRQDEQGYIDHDTYVSGFPFPQPSGKHKGIQIIYNYVKRYVYGESYYHVSPGIGINNRFKIDFETCWSSPCLKLEGRVCQPPYGWFDKRAEKQRESEILWSLCTRPRDLYGNVYCCTTYSDPDKPDLSLYYVNAMRRVRRLSASDKQDPSADADAIWDDSSGGFRQQITPNRYPYTYRVIEEREYLAPITTDGSPYIDSKNKFIFKNLTFERRPVVVLEMIQQDPNYVYSKRIMYFDREILMPLFIMNFDRKGRLYRTADSHLGFLPPQGQFMFCPLFLRDFIDVHSGQTIGHGYPALWVSREDTSISAMSRSRK